MSTHGPAPLNVTTPLPNDNPRPRRWTRAAPRALTPAHLPPVSAALSSVPVTAGAVTHSTATPGAGNQQDGQHDMTCENRPDDPLNSAGATGRKTNDQAKVPWWRRRYEVRMRSRGGEAVIERKWGKRAAQISAREREITTASITGCPIEYYVVARPDTRFLR